MGFKKIRLPRMTLGILLWRVSKCFLINLFLRWILRKTLNVSLFFFLLCGPPKKKDTGWGSSPQEQTLPQDGTTALHLAAHFGSNASVDVLLDASCDPNAARSDNGATAVHLAAQAGQVQALRKLFLGLYMEDWGLEFGMLLLSIAVRPWALLFFWMFPLSCDRVLLLGFVFKIIILILKTWISGKEVDKYSQVQIMTSGKFACNPLKACSGYPI